MSVVILRISFAIMSNLQHVDVILNVIFKLDRLDVELSVNYVRRAKCGLFSYAERLSQV